MVSLACFLGVGILLGLTPFAFPTLRLGLAIPDRKGRLTFHLGAALALAALGAALGLPSHPLAAVPNSRVLTAVLAIGIGLWGVIGAFRPATFDGRLGIALSAVGVPPVIWGLVAGVLDAALIFPLMANSFPALLDPPSPLWGALEFAALGFGLASPTVLLAEVTRDSVWLRQMARRPSSRRVVGSVLVLAAAVYGVLCFHPRPAPQAASGLPWYTDEATAFAQARLRHLPVMIDFSATWCFPCHALDELVFSAEDVEEEIEKRVIPLRLDLSEDNAHTQALEKKYGVDSLPTVLFLTPEGKVLDSPLLNGVVPPDAFLAALHSL